MKNFNILIFFDYTSSIIWLEWNRQNMLYPLQGNKVIYLNQSSQSLKLIKTRASKNLLNTICGQRIKTE